MQRLISRVSKFSLALAAASVFTAAAVNAAPIYDVNQAPTVVSTHVIGQPGGANPAATPAVTPGAFYSNITTFTGFGINTGGAPASGAKFTRMLMDDINTVNPGITQLGKFVWSGANLNSVAVSAAPCIRFFAADGPGGTPGTLLGGINFNAISFPASQISGLQFDATSQNIFLPQNFWAGEFFSMASTVTQARANNMGQGTFDPPDVGTSADRMFTTTATATATGSFVTALPPGSDQVSPFSGAPVANMEWEFNPVPEPTTLGVAGIAMLGLFSRRRRA